MARPNAIDEVATYEECKTIRSARENDWRLASAYCLPAHYGSWTTEGPVMMGQGLQATKRQVFDTSGTRSLPKYMAVLERLATPYGVRYQLLRPSDPNLMRHRRVREYFDTLTDLVMKYRNNAYAHFRQASNEVYAGLGVYGTGPTYIGQRPKNALYNAPGFIYKACSLRDIFLLVDDNGEVVGVYRRFYLNARQFKAKFPDATPPASIAAELKKPTPAEGQFFEFVHAVRIRNDHDPQAIDARRHPCYSSYIAIKEKEYVGDEEGYRSIPYITPRTFTIAGDPYGFSPAQMALSALGGASAIKKVYLKQGNKAVDPVLLAYDDGVMNGQIDLRPGAINYGGIDKQGRQLIQALNVGNFQVAEKLLEKDIDDVEDCFFVKLFTFLDERPEMTATQVIEEVAEKAAMLSPTMGRVQSEFLAPATGREIDLLDEMGLLPDMPPELVEANGEYENVYTSPMAKGMYAEQTSGFMRTLETALNVAAQTGDASALDHFNLDVAIPEIADNQSVPVRWMNDERKVEELRKARAAQQQTQQLLQNAGGVAQAVKAANEVANPQ